MTDLLRVRITEQDWVGVRLLSLLLSADTSSVTIPDVQKAIEYYEEKYSKVELLIAINALNKERAQDKTWANPSSRLIRNALTENVERYHGEDYVRDIP